MKSFSRFCNSNSAMDTKNCDGNLKQLLYHMELIFQEIEFGFSDLASSLNGRFDF